MLFTCKTTIFQLLIRKIILLVELTWLLGLIKNKGKKKGILKIKSLRLTFSPCKWRKMFKLRVKKRRKKKSLNWAMNVLVNLISIVLWSFWMCDTALSLGVHQFETFFLIDCLVVIPSKFSRWSLKNKKPEKQRSRLITI